jgi:phosphatidylcholine synthase
MFVWLVVAFIVDGIDGPMARRRRRHRARPDHRRRAARPRHRLPDVRVRARVRAAARRAAHRLGRFAAAFAVVFASALYFADTRMKTPDKSFSGFPAAWNMVALVIFAIRPDPRAVLVVVLVLTVAMFVPVRFVHPVRTGRWWQLSLPVAIAWTVLAGWAAWVDFTQPEWASVALIATSLYLGTVGALQQLLGREGVGPG